MLQNIATKDLATSAIQESLLNVQCLGAEQLALFVKERLMPVPEEPRPVKFRDPLQKNKAATFSTLYEVQKEVKGKQTIMKADRSILQRLITAYEAGRKVDLEKILEHELMPVPVSIAEMNGTLRSGSKSLLADVLTKDIPCPTISPEGTSCLIIDGQALVQAIGKPHGATSFGDLADTLVKSVMQMGAKFDRIDVVFDRYYTQTIKGGTRQKRSKGTRPIRRLIESRDVPLPINPYRKEN